MIKNKLNKKVLVYLVAVLVVFTSIIVVSVNAQDTTQPRIVEVTPNNNQLSVGTREVITVKFSEQMDPRTINQNTFIVMLRTTPAENSKPSDYRSIQVEGTVTYDSSSRTATFTPDEGLTANPLQPSQEFGNVFTVTITTGAKDLEGNSISQNYIWSFSTGNNPFNTGDSTSQQQQTTDTTRPRIVEVTPNNNQLAVGTHDVIKVEFSERMDPRTINENTFVVEQRTTPAENSKSSDYRSMQVEGTVTYDGLTATFWPDKGKTANPLQPSQEFGNVFTVTITTGAKDLEGNSISQNYIWSFSTGNNPFNTGDSTSQQQQTAVPVTTTTTTANPSNAPVTGAVTGNQPTTTNNSPWNWIFGGLVLIALIALIVTMVVNSRSQKNKKITMTSRRTSKPNPFGDVHPVKEIEGIGPEYNSSLQAMGIRDTKQLWKANAMKIARETGAPISSVRSWQNMAELASVNSIGPQYAELLERSGIHNISQLKTYRPKQLLKMVREKQDSIDMSIQGNVPGHALVENWIDEARSHKFSAAEV